MGTKVNTLLVMLRDPSLSGAAAKTLCLDAADEIERLRNVIGGMECSCLPYAKPGDGTMCPRCEALSSI